VELKGKRKYVKKSLYQRLSLHHRPTCTTLISNPVLNHDKPFELRDSRSETLTASATTPVVITGLNMNLWQIQQNRKEASVEECQENGAHRESRCHMYSLLHTGTALFSSTRMFAQLSDTVIVYPASTC
jgi:hypothetical protein